MCIRDSYMSHTFAILSPLEPPAHPILYYFNIPLPDILVPRHLFFQQVTLSVLSYKSMIMCNSRAIVFSDSISAVKYSI